MVHLDLALLTRVLSTSKKDAGKRSQKERLFIRGKLMSAAPAKRGISQFLNLPIKKGIIKKKTIITL